MCTAFHLYHHYVGVGSGDYTGSCVVRADTNGLSSAVIIGMYHTHIKNYCSSQGLCLLSSAASTATSVNVDYRKRRKTVSMEK